MKISSIFPWFVISLLLVPIKLSAKGGMSNELGFTMMYDSLKSPTGTLAALNFSGFYLVPAKAIWCGGEWDYGTTSNSSYSTKTLEVGGLIKYWVMDPGDGFSFNLFAGVALGNQNDGLKNYSTMTIKTGPEFAYFFNEGVAISTRLQYASRKTDTSYTGLGLRSGLSLFF